MSMREVLENKTDDELKGMHRQLHRCIRVTNCFSPNDILTFDAVTSELEKRGYTIFEGEPEYQKF